MRCPGNTIFWFAIVTDFNTAPVLSHLNPFAYFLHELGGSNITQTDSDQNWRLIAIGQPYTAILQLKLDIICGY
jgi:hypothetical protein